MAQTTDPDVAIIVDDELHNVSWLCDFLENSGLKVLQAETMNDGIELITGGIFRVLIIDLNIPVLPPLENAVSAKGKEYEAYPGLYIAERARNEGYRDRQVILYSVHRDRAVAEIADRLGVTYIMKGRPSELKLELASVLKFDPTLKT